MTDRSISEEDATVAVTRDGAVIRLSQNRPRARNAQNRQMLDTLDAKLREAIDDDSVRVIIIAGEGEHFSAGHDLKQAQAERADFSVEQRWDFESRRYFDYCLRVWDCPKPVIAEVQGACIAGAFMLANLCDLVVASDDAYFSDPVAHTLATASIEVLIHPWVMGLRRAKQMLYTGERIDAAEAYRIGMVNEVVPRAALPAETMALAQRIAAAPPFALRLLKRSLNRGAEAQGMKLALQAHFETHQLSHVSQEFQQVRARGLAGAIADARSHGDARPASDSRPDAG
ncbi:MAG: enoyl-CoA hydratase [Burkholderiaceae bacterium]